MKAFRAILALAFAGALALSAGVLYISWIMQTAAPLTRDEIVFIPPGTSVTNIADTFAAQNALDSKAKVIFPYYARLTGAGGNLQAGEYKITPGMSAADIIQLLEDGNTIKRQITIPEGLTSFEIIALLNAAPAMEGEVTDLPDEGSLLPESYAYIRGDRRPKIIERMQNQMRETLNTLWPDRAKDLPFNTQKEAVILASIVEKETGIPDERPRVAGVFINRLRKGMPLQSDPTVIYAITHGQGKLNRKLYYKDLKRKDPYNTYYAAGLPPGPIANPGRASLEAVLNPENHDYVYFVADGTGGHVFSKTLAEHNRNVAKWRKIQNAQ